jgi:two-component system, chemotaxis family, protein-glutamate methylesterase/glutaminase
LPSRFSGGNVTRPPKKIVLLGGSAGGIEAISTILSVLPADFPAALFVVVHLNPSVPSLLADILGRKCRLRVMHARDGVEIESGVVYVGPPDRHLTVHEGFVRLGRGPRENGFRPALDPLFRSAAANFRDGVIGVIVSGNLDDGTTGLFEVKRQNGVAIVQDPDDAIYKGMPASAIQEVAVDYVLPASAIGERIVALVNESRLQSITVAPDVEPDIAIGGESALMMEEREDGHPASLGCPDCGGTLWEMQDGELVRYRCRVGHAFSDESLLAAQTETLETALWTALRALEETEEQALRIAKRMSKRGHPMLADRFERQAVDARRRARIVRDALALNQGNNDEIQVG